MSLSPPLRDPVGLLARSPELAALAERHPALRRSIEQGRPLDAYRALFWAHWRRRFGDLGSIAATLLARRRLFLKPITSPPAMITFNGVGTSLYGRSDQDPNDGTYVATLFLVLVFVPVFPIASYLVRDGQRSGRRSWSFMAKVPLGIVTHLWQRGVAVALLVLLAVGASHAFEGYAHNTLHVVNGLDRPVTAALSGAVPVAVPPGQEVPIRTTVGKHALEVRDGQRVIESATVDLPRGGTTVAWNVLGAAPVYLAQEVYTKEGSSAQPGDAAPQVMCGESLIVRTGVEYAFTDPPKSVEMSDTVQSVVKSHMAVAPGGATSCMNYFSAHQAQEKGARLTLAIARATGATATGMEDALDNAIAILPEAEGEAYAKDLLSRDDSIEANRIYQNVLLVNQLRDRAITEYDRRLASKPGADSEYLAMRVRTQPEERKTIDAVVARFPDHAFLRRAQIFVHYADLDLPEAAAACDALKRLDEKLWAGSIQECADALVGAGRGKEAIELLRARSASLPTPSDKYTADLLAYRVAHRIGVTVPELSAEGDDDETAPVYAHAVTGLPIEPAMIGKIKDEQMREALRIVTDARTSPDAAFARIRKADPLAIGRLPEVTRVLLLAEAARRDDASDVAEKLAKNSFEKRAADTMTSFVRTGVLTEDIYDVSLELRAALEFGRSRLASLSVKEKTELAAQAKASDILQGPVTVALTGWAP